MYDVVFVCSPLCLKTIEDFQLRAALIVIRSRGETSGPVTAAFLSKFRACFVRCKVTCVDVNCCSVLFAGKYRTGGCRYTCPFGAVSNRLF